MEEVERRFGDLMRLLTAVDGWDARHGRFHRIKEDKERELWALLDQLPSWPGAPRLILSTIDDVYLGYHGNGHWGWSWYWPYFSCPKTLILSERLVRDYPGFVEEALWTKIYCYRIRGLGEDGFDNTEKSEAMKAHHEWRSDPEKVRDLCRELITGFPEGKYTDRARKLLKMQNLGISLPYHPVAGHIPRGADAMIISLVPYDGPAFLMDRRPR